MNYVFSTFWSESILFTFILFATQFVPKKKEKYGILFKIFGFSLICISILILHTGANTTENFLKFLLFISAGMILVNIHQILIEDGIATQEWLILFLNILMGGLIAISSTNFLGFFIGLELQNLAFTVLSALKKDSEYSFEPSIKFFICNTLSIFFMLFGIAILYYALGTINFDLLNQKFETTSYTILGYASIAAAFCFKFGIFPFHEWMLDLYKGLDNASLLCFNTIFKVTIFAVALKLYSVIFIHIPWLQDLIIFLCIISMILSSIGGIGQSDPKRLLAYSTIGNGCFLALGIFNGMNQQNYIFYIFCYLITNMSTFFSLLFLKGNLRTGLIFTQSKLSTTFLISVLALGGIVPFPLFFAKILIFYRLIESRAYFSTFAAIISAIISMFFYLKLAKAAYTSHYEEEETIHFWKIFFPVLLAILLLFSFIWAPLLGAHLTNLLQ